MGASRNMGLLIKSTVDYDSATHYNSIIKVAF